MSDVTGTAAGEVPMDETSRLISSEKVEGTAVYGADRERIGDVETVMIDKYSGQVAYAVVSFGGFLGIGERYHPLPWKVLTYDTGLGGYVVNVTRQQLEGAPTYEADRDPWEEPGYGRRVYDYYGVTYPWV